MDVDIDGRLWIQTPIYLSFGGVCTGFTKNSMREEDGDLLTVRRGSALLVVFC